MSLSLKQFKRASAVCVALGSILATGQAFAAGTAPNTQVDNIASVNYSVGGVAQTVIRSAPGAGNSTPGTGAGAVTRFVVDRKVDLYVQEVSGAVTGGVVPGSANNVTTFFIRNDGNDTQGVNLSGAAFAAAVFGNATTSGVTLTNIRAFVESTAAVANATTCQNPIDAALTSRSFTLGTDTGTTIPTFAPDTCNYVYIVVDTPTNAQNGNFANVELTAVARNPTSLTQLTESTGADDPAVVDVVFADPSATVAARDGYRFVTAAFTVTKASSVISDGVSTSNFKAIPGAVMEYAITLANGGNATADSVSVSDALPTQTTFVANQYNGLASDVRITVGATNTFCIAEANGLDGNGDGCFRTTAAGVTTLTVRNPAILPVAAAGSVVVRFRVSIN
jgi:uncharacterized repeat protein (TIGR01451 family)